MVRCLWFARLLNIQVAPAVLLEEHLDYLQYNKAERIPVHLIARFGLSVVKSMVSDDFLQHVLLHRTCAMRQSYLRRSIKQGSIFFTVNLRG